MISHLCSVDDATLTTYLEGDVLVSETDLELLTSVLILLWPFGIVFPVVGVSPPSQLSCSSSVAILLQNLAGLNNALDLLDHSRADAHWVRVSIVKRWCLIEVVDVLSLRMRESLR